MLKKIFGPGEDSAWTHFALLVLRVWLGITMLSCHGYEKLVSFGKKADSFPDPLGVGHATSLALVVLAEFFGSLLLILGLLTRLGALVLAITMAVAFFAVHKGALSGPQSGELAFIYLAGYVTLFFAGPGRFSVDGSLFGRAPSRAA
ncbi:MAG: DoxX family protein [Verrucomicrobiae bacterium]|nr:DoxX family protein [Verrucomicrobiae bacterium]MDW8309275.1 DoxX family protein [Verrucomicrobiales bacterium]